MRVSSIRSRRFLWATGFGIANALSAVYAAEGAGGHYLPGALASTIDMTPPSETFAVRFSVNNYDGELKERELQVPIAGLIATEVEVDSEEFAFSLIWNPGWEPAEGWTYAMSASIPYVSVKISANIVDEPLVDDQVSRKVADEDTGVGDLILQPLMLSHAIDRTWYGDFRFAIYAPTGGYELGRLANVGKNYWTFAPTLALIHIEPAIGREFSVFGGFDISTKNTDTDYHTGIETHIESSYVQYLLLLGGFTGIGVSGYWYQQITGDRGSGATLGDFKSKAVGAGPVLSYKTKWADTEIMSELKWLHEFETKRHPEGDTIFFKILAKY